MNPERCPCGSGDTYDACCGRLHRGEAAAATPEQLMRARFSGFAVGEVDFLLRSWHPDTRPATLELDREQQWTRLEVLSSSGGLFDPRGEVDFRAHYRRGDERGVLEEHSRFVREDGTWLYLDGF
ncbi:SEC-C motif-containing protein [Motilibacter peucedani]|uniref:UPF0225 protein CLV35_3674 n=1 Tax=Motilibacter peucedani TaxID=598650 RepID=A0A420XKJ1_9ACTN|nr:YchJ family metal-binding protein [Motilibacter peucedani]RKS68546.1 SEC-C motif-containing protein [Motilibacter peucedani]